MCHSSPPAGRRRTQFGRPGDELSARFVAMVAELLVGQGTPTTSGLIDPVRRRTHVMVGLDGRSGAGKSTLAAAACTALRRRGWSCSVIDGDDFYLGGTATTWDGRTAEQNVAQVIDWRRQRVVLDALRAGRHAEYRAYDWDRFDDSWCATATVVAPTSVVLLDGVYSCRPELHELIDLKVLLDVEVGLRDARLATREGAGYRDDWYRRWTAAEEHYFRMVMPPPAFDLVLTERAPS